MSDDESNDEYPGDDVVADYLRRHVAQSHDERPYVKERLMDGGHAWDEHNHSHNLNTAYHHILKPSREHMRSIRRDRRERAAAAAAAALKDAQEQVELQQAVEQLANDEASGRFKDDDDEERERKHEHKHAAHHHEEPTKKKKKKKKNSGGGIVGAIKSLFTKKKKKHDEDESSSDDDDENDLPLTRHRQRHAAGGFGDQGAAIPELDHEQQRLIALLQMHTAQLAASVDTKARVLFADPAFAARGKQIAEDLVKAGQACALKHPETSVDAYTSSLATIEDGENETEYDAYANAEIETEA